MLLTELGWMCSLPLCTIDVSYCPETCVSFQPVFVKVVSNQPLSRDTWPEPAAYFDGTGTETRIEMFEVHRLSSPTEKWFVLITPDNQASGRVRVTVNEDITRFVTLKEEAEEEKSKSQWARKLFREANGSHLMMSLLEHQGITLTSSGRAKLLAITTSFPNTEYARFANFIIGCALFQDLEREFNNDGPNHCFGATYAFFERAIEKRDHDPVFAETLRRFALAKAWSSEFDKAAEYCEALIAANVSSEMTETAKKGLAELQSFERERRTHLRERKTNRQEP